MGKKIVILLSIIMIAVGIVVTFLLVPASDIKKEKNTIYIAIAGPMSGQGKDNGEDMINGSQLYLDEIQASGKLKDINIELEAFNDRDKRSAIKIASQITDEKKIMLMLGHFDSSAALAAGNIYKKNGLPAITASATADGEIFTSANGWYFRTIAGTSFIRNFLLNYLNKELGVNSISLIFDNNYFGGALSKTFEKESEKANITIQNKWEFDSDEGDPVKKVFSIIGDISSILNPDFILCGANEKQSVEIFTNLLYPGTNYRVIGPETFSTSSFISQFESVPQENKIPGYFSDGIYSASPFIAYLADSETALNFRQRFITKYNKEPSWVAACYYDAMKVAVEAIKKTEFQFGDIRDDRRRLKEALSRIDNPDVSVSGVTGDIYFNNDGNNAISNLTVGLWQNQTFIPAFSQYQRINGTPLAIPKEQTLSIDNQDMTRIKVVYAGIDIINILNVDINKGIYTIDFLLWFRFSGDLDATQIEFLNAENPILLGVPVFEKTFENVTTRTYRIVATFKGSSFKKDLVPFDNHVLSIGFRHLNKNRTQLIYVPDIPGLNIDHSPKKFEENLILGWNINNISFMQEKFNTLGHMGEIIPYSSLRADIHIERKQIVSCLLRMIYPILGMALLLYVVGLIPVNYILIRTMIILSTLMMAAITHLINIEYKIIVYGSLSLYILGFISVILSVYGNILYKKGKTATVQLLS